MTKQKITIVLIALIVLVVYTSGAALAIKNEKSHLNFTQAHTEKSKHNDENLDKIVEARLYKLHYIAQYFDINTDGKSIDQIIEEIREAKRLNPEKWMMFKKELHDKKLELLEQKSTNTIR